MERWEKWSLLFLTTNSCSSFQSLVLLSCLMLLNMSGPGFPALSPCSFFHPHLLSSPSVVASFLPPAQVTADRNKTAVRGKKASLSCSYGLPEKVEQVMWRHNPELGDSNEVASFAKRSDPMIEPPYQGRVWLSPSLSDSQLTIQPVAVQDEGCYTCVYHTYSDGPKSATVCLSTFGKNHFLLACLVISRQQTARYFSGFSSPEVK